MQENFRLDTSGPISRGEARRMERDLSIPRTTTLVPADKVITRRKMAGIGGAIALVATATGLAGGQALDQKFVVPTQVATAQQQSATQASSASASQVTDLQRQLDATKTQLAQAQNRASGDEGQIKGLQQQIAALTRPQTCTNDVVARRDAGLFGKVLGTSYVVYQQHCRPT